MDKTTYSTSLRTCAPPNRASSSMGRSSWCHSPHKPSHTLCTKRHNRAYSCRVCMNTRHQGFYMCAVNAYCRIALSSCSRSHHIHFYNCFFPSRLWIEVVSENWIKPKLDERIESQWWMRNFSMCSIVECAECSIGAWVLLISLTTVWVFSLCGVTDLS